MPAKTRRRVFEAGHHRKFLVVVDDSSEFEVALYFAARVANRTGGRLAMLYINEPVKLRGWYHIKGNEQDDLKARAEEEIVKFRGKLDEMGLKGLKTETIIRTGDKQMRLSR